ncbi:unnamed protein product [Owenia fusiformis]|uniref:UDP-glucuronosyltransferase n=1 Tax=Owenia fusiformis TaxID=6347 RepID=A0A8S4PFD7_OWEFU|nr:unnamed protein product [Owenia fusiformis]
MKEAGSQIYYWKSKMTPEKLSDVALGAKGEKNSQHQIFINVGKVMFENIVPFLEDEKVFVKLKEDNYDIALVDVFPPASHIFIIPYKLNITFCTLSTQYIAEFMGTPALPSFIPDKLTPYTEQMTLDQRIMNFIKTLMLGHVVKTAFQSTDDSLVRLIVPERPPISIIPDLIKMSACFLINTDPLMDYQRPKLSNIVDVGGLTIQPAKPLPKQFENFISKSSGFIIVSFGSIVNSIDDDIAEKMIKAFGNIKYGIIWRYPGNNTMTLPNNVMIAKWLPQNDLLANAKAKLFITHCGNNGQFEALQHGIPMLGMPFFGDQHYNSMRMHYKGYGIHMDLLHFTADELKNNINEIISNPDYTKRIKKASRIFKSQENPRKRAVAAIKHVVDFGSDHLRPITVDMPLWKLWMVDIFASITLGILLVLFIAKLVLGFLFRRLWTYCFGKFKED